MASKCSICKTKEDPLWPRLVGGKRKMVCSDCKDQYPRG